MRNIHTPSTDIKITTREHQEYHIQRSTEIEVIKSHMKKQTL